MLQKKILILGANDKQVQLIRASKKQGYYVIVCDFDCSRPGVEFADIVYPVNYMDQKAVLSVAKQEQIDGVIGNNDPAMPIVAYVAEQLGLVGNKQSSIDSLVSKYGFREFQENAGVFCPKHIETDDYAEVAEAIRTFNDSIVIKPSLSAGSQGTTKVQKKQTDIIRNAFEACKGFSRNGKVTIEEYVEMPSLEVIEGDIFVKEDEILWNGIFTTGRSKNASMLPMTYIFPAILTENQFEVVKTSIAKVFKEAGIRHGQYNIEMYFTNKGELFIIEVNPRQGGHHIPKWIQEHTGIDYTKLLVTTAMGDSDYFNSVKDTKPVKNYHTHHVVFSDFSGVLDEVVIDPAIREYVTNVELIKHKGDKVNQRTIARDRTIGYVSLEFPDRETQLSYCGARLETLIYSVVKLDEE
jgi:biotin carboxylase